MNISYLFDRFAGKANNYRVGLLNCLANFQLPIFTRMQIFVINPHIEFIRREAGDQFVYNRMIFFSMTDKNPQFLWHYFSLIPR